MNCAAVYHRSDSEFCFAINENTVVLRLRVAKGESITRIDVMYNIKYDIFKSQHIAELSNVRSDSLFDWYEAAIVLSDPRLCYYFRLCIDGEYKYYSENGIESEYDISYSYFSAFQFPYISPGDVHRLVPWVDGAVYYQIFVDRFAIGGKHKNREYINLSWGDIPTPKSFAGGDIPGITQNLLYIKELGVNALYLTPVFLSPSNHKYDTVDYEKIDPHFGSEADLKQLVDTAHQMGMRVVLDGVFNHISSNSAQFKDAIKRKKDSPYYDWFKFTEKGYETFARCSYMPKINTECRAARDYLIGIGLKYIKEYDIDGWRLDVADELSHSFLREFRLAVKAEKPDCVIIGEDWHDSRAFLRGDQFDGVMNYAFTKACLDIFALSRFTPRQFVWRLNELLMRNTENATRMAFNLLDSHDTNRFYTDTGKDFNATLAAYAAMVFYPGSMCIFYGDELPTEGGYDPDCRRTFDSSLANEGYNRDFRALISLRAMDDFASRDVSIWENGGVVFMKRGSVTLSLNCGEQPAEVQPNGKTLLFRNYNQGRLEKFGYIITQKEN